MRAAVLVALTLAAAAAAEENPQQRSIWDHDILPPQGLGTLLTADSARFGAPERMDRFNDVPGQTCSAMCPAGPCRSECDEGYKCYCKCEAEMCVCHPCYNKQWKGEDGKENDVATIAPWKGRGGGDGPGMLRPV